MIQESWGYTVPEGYSVDQFFRVQFYSFELESYGGNPKVTWHNSIRCKDKYEDSFAHDLIKKDEFFNENWICPDVDDIKILHNPDFYGSNGTTFNMVINTCEDAAAINLDKGLKDYNSTDPSVCYGSTSTVITKEKFDEIASQFSFRSKIMSQDPSDPAGYEETSRSKTYFTSRI